MIRCVANNYSALGFWRSWHRSFNLWVVRYVPFSSSQPLYQLDCLRYIYVPVGGSKNIIPATLLVFTFVALWHDLSFKLLAWGWLVSLFLVPEILVRKLFAADKVCGGFYVAGRTTYHYDRSMERILYIVMPAL